jgi:hypothetical protein
MGSIFANVEPWLDDQQVQYQRLMYQYVGFYRHLIIWRSRIPPVDQKELLGLNSMVDELESAIRANNRVLAEEQNAKIINTIRSYDIRSITSTKNAGQHKPNRVTRTKRLKPRRQK